ncbi:MAG: selenium-binding protein SBP56-related protein [Thermoanaerobaculia bacterium]
MPDGPPASAEAPGLDGDAAPREELLYVVCTDGQGDNPDFLAVIGADPSKPGLYGRILNRVDMPHADDELHHFGYSLDQERLIVPGLFSNRIHVFDVEKNPRRPRLVASNDIDVESGYIVPHTVIGLPDHKALVTMIGAASETTGPGGVVLIDDRTGEFIDYFGPGPDRDPEAIPPKYMYDFGFNLELNRAISTTFGWPAGVGGGINPAGLGDEIAVWDFEAQEVLQRVDLGANSGALEVRWIDEPGSTLGVTNAPGTNSLWLWEDEDGDGLFTFHQVLSAEDGLAGPMDIVLTEDHGFLYVGNWLGDTVQKFDISDPFDPVLVDEVTLPHPNMLRLSPDGERLYVTNQLVTPWDNDPALGGPRNDHYGIWLFQVQDDESLESVTEDGSAWVDMTDVKMRFSRGPAGPHQIFFGPEVPIELGHH